jgi:hypothetical protein
VLKRKIGACAVVSSGVQSFAFEQLDRCVCTRRSWAVFQGKLYGADG